MARVFVAMSGGVDSSVAAAILLEAGHDVTGVTMQLLPEGESDGQCCGTDAVHLARRVCGVLGIPHFTLNLRDVFEREVMSLFAAEYACGRTPNPCVACNDRVKFRDLIAWALSQGADFLATGHYARILRGTDDLAWLARARDTDKDQSYFLYRLTSPALDRVWFPVGEMTKPEVRVRAASLMLPTAERPDSQEVCFVAPGRHAEFVADRHPEAASAGPIVDREGRVLGCHSGLARYTVGQRKGLGVASAAAVYVLAVDASANSIVVGPASGLDVTSIEADQSVWRLCEGRANVEVQWRYRMRPEPAWAELRDGRLRLSFDAPVRAVAPGQAVVCYAEDRVVAGGVVSWAR